MSNVQGFTSYDTADGLGIRAQVIVTKGELPVKNISLNDAGTMAKVDFDASAAGLKYAIHANVPVADRSGKENPAYEALINAMASGEPIAFRIETQRKRDIDRRLPFPPSNDSDKKADVTYLKTQKGEEVIKILVSAGDVTTHEIRTDVSEDARWANIVRAMAPAFIDEMGVANSVAGAGLDPELVLSQYVAAVQANLPQEMTRIIGALAIAAGASIDDFIATAGKAKAA
jgi:hypothetical protein